MLRGIFTCILLMSVAQAQSLQSIIEHTLEQHASLKSIEKRLSAVDDAITVSQTFTNPELSVVITSGIISSTLLTLLILPSTYLLFYQNQHIVEEEATDPSRQKSALQ